MYTKSTIVRQNNKNPICSSDFIKNNALFNRKDIIKNNDLLPKENPSYADQSKYEKDTQRAILS